MGKTNGVGTQINRPKPASKPTGKSYFLGFCPPALPQGAPKDSVLFSKDAYNASYTALGGKVYDALVGLGKAIGSLFHK